MEPIREMGFEYAQLVSFIQKEIDEGNAKYNNGKMIITPKGSDLIKELEGGLKGFKAWIEPEIQSKIPKLDKNDVFLPNQNDLWFN